MSKFCFERKKLIGMPWENMQLTVSQASWTKVYEAWKELTNALLRGYTNCGFEAWTVPCLYVAGKYIRIFAIKADEATGASTGSVNNFQDDFNPEAEKNEKLEDAARQLNRVFQLCLSDRSVHYRKQTLRLTDSQVERLLRIRENGASIISSICYSRHTSN
jgi:hypothetical protein